MAGWGVVIHSLLGRGKEGSSESLRMWFSWSASGLGAKFGTPSPPSSLEDLYVAEEYRGQGISKLLFKHLGDLAREKDLARIDWVVLDWNEVRSKFLSICSRSLLAVD